MDHIQDFSPFHRLHLKGITKQVLEWATRLDLYRQLVWIHTDNWILPPPPSSLREVNSME